MKYNQPYGVVDPDASFIDAIPVTGIEGSIIPAGAVEFPQREIVNMILKNQLTPNNGDQLQLTKASQVDLINWAIDIGTQNHIVINLDPAPDTLVAGLKAWVLVKIGNSGTTDVTCNGIVRPLLTQALVNLPAGVIVTNGISVIVYDGTQWQLMLGTAATAGPAGPTGAQGITGATGLQGLAGAKGDKGDKGDAGSAGPPGSPTSLVVTLWGVGIYAVIVVPSNIVEFTPGGTMSMTGSGVINGQRGTGNWSGGTYGVSWGGYGGFGTGTWRPNSATAVIDGMSSPYGFMLAQRIA